MSNTDPRKVIIIGSGPAGLTAAIYTARANLAPLVIEGEPSSTSDQPGGQLMLTTDVENFPGFPEGIMGPELMARFRKQAERFGTQFVPGRVVKADVRQRPFVLDVHDTLQDTRTTVRCRALIVATGASAKWLGLGRDEELSRTGGGVSACATCDGFFFRGKVVAVVGGGDTALEEATYLTKHASKVFLIHRRDQFRASKAMQEHTFSNPKVEVLWNRTVAELLTEEKLLPSGDTVEKLRGLALKDTRDGSASELPVDGLFVAIGHQPNTRLLEGQLPLDPSGYLRVEKGSTRTAIPGVFAAGDVADPSYRQAITAAGSGCMAAIDAERWLTEQGIGTEDPCPS